MKRMIKNPMLMTDFYKTIHHLAYTPGLEFLVSYWTPRMSRIPNVDKVVMFGLQAYTQKWLINAFNEDFFNVPWETIKEEYERLIRHTMTAQAANTDFLKELHDLGYLPIEISAVEEGTRIPLRCPMFQIKNTVKGFGWLVNFIETLTSCNVWGPMTAATIAYNFRENAQKFYDMSIVPTDPYAPPVSALCGDFSMRGMMSPDAALAMSSGHLTSFTGTATIPAIAWLEAYYNCDCTKEVVGKGVPSTEHSVMSSYGRDCEFECYRHLIEDVFPNGPLSIVSDTYDYWNVLTNYVPKLKDSILARDGKIIIRGDSGDPIDIICGELKAEDYLVIDGLTEDSIKDYFKNYAKEKWCGDCRTHTSWFNVRIDDNLYYVEAHHKFIEDECEGFYIADVEDVTFEKSEITPAMKGTVELLWETFGGYVNAKGYKVLDRHIGAIYGDSITIDRAIAIWKRLTDKGFAISNVTLGIGSFTYQYNTRDSLGFCLKATHSIINGEERQIYKDPITDKVKGNNFKKSQKGACYLYKNEDGEVAYTDLHTLEELKDDKYKDNLLVPVFRDGKLLKETSLAEIRRNLYGDNF